jgi:hypothetical protein
MSTLELEMKRMGIFRQLLNVKNEVVLQEIENLLYEQELPVINGYSVQVLRDAVSRSKEDIKNGRVYTMKQMREKHPRI